MRRSVVRAISGGGSFDQRFGFGGSAGRPPVRAGAQCLSAARLPSSRAGGSIRSRCGSERARSAGGASTRGAGGLSVPEAAEEAGGRAAGGGTAAGGGAGGGAAGGRGAGAAAGRGAGAVPGTSGARRRFGGTTQPGAAAGGATGVTGAGAIGRGRRLLRLPVFLRALVLLRRHEHPRNWNSVISIGTWRPCFHPRGKWAIGSPFRSAGGMLAAPRRCISKG